MLPRLSLLLSLALVFACLAPANKKKDSLPAEVLNAQTVVVLVDPDAGMATSAPLANRTAQEDFEERPRRVGQSPTLRLNKGSEPEPSRASFVSPDENIMRTSLLSRNFVP